MTPAEAGSLATTLVVALAGAALFYLIGFPAAALTGAASAITIASLAGLRVAMPDWLRVLTFVILGINIGTGVTPEMLRTALLWPASIALLAASLVASMVVARHGLQRWMGFGRAGATLAAAPGHLSFVLALSLDGAQGDTARIAVVQSVRVLFLTLCVPLLVTVLFGATGVQVLPEDIVSPVSGAVLVAATLLVGWLLLRLRVPAAYLLAGMGVSAAGHVMSLTPGRLPDAVTFVALLLMGTLIGSRFAGQTLSQIRSAMVAGVWVTAVSVAGAVAGIIVAMLALGLPPALLIVAFAPGGVEAMAAIAISLGLDPAFVAAHHVARLMLLTLIIPAMMHTAGPDTTR